MKYTKKQINEAKIMALTNAAEMIRGMHESGGFYQEDFRIPLELIYKENARLANFLDKKARKIHSNHPNGIKQ